MMPSFTNLYINESTFPFRCKGNPDWQIKKVIHAFRNPNLYKMMTNKEIQNLNKPSFVSRKNDKLNINFRSRGNTFYFQINLNLAEEIDQLIYYFSEELIIVNKRKYFEKTPYECWKDNKIQNMIVENLATIADTESFKEISREMIYHKSPDCRRSRISVIHHLFRLFNINNKKVLDPFGRWGETVLASMLFEPSKITIIDPDPMLSNAVNCMKKSLDSYYPKFSKRTEILTNDFSNMDMSSLGIFNYIITSIPLYGCESDPYSNRFCNIEEWIQKFYKPVLIKMSQVIETDGYLIINIINIRSEDRTKWIKLDRIMVSTLKNNMDFLGTINYYLGSSNYTRTFIVFKKRG